MHISYVENNENGDELSEAESDAEFIGRERRDHRGATFADEIRDASNVNIARRERRGYGCFSHWQGNARMSRFKGAAVVATVAAHNYLSSVDLQYEWSFWYVNNKSYPRSFMHSIKWIFCSGNILANILPLWTIRSRSARSWLRIRLKVFPSQANT